MQLELLNFGIAGESRRHSETKALLFIIGSQTDGRFVGVGAIA